MNPNEVTSRLKIFTISNQNGMELKVLNYGATIISLMVANKYGNKTNVVVGLSSAEKYLEEPYTNNLLFLGSSIGRYAGRISKGLFVIDNEVFPIYNKNGTHLHGGKKGFDSKYWKLEAIDDKSSITLSYVSKHLEEGYPGNLHAKVTYSLLDNNTLKVTYTANTDKLTPVNLTNHAYFNLDGEGSILKHNLQIFSKQYLEVDQALLPTGKLNFSKGTRFDFNLESIISRKDFIGFDNVFLTEDTGNKSASLCSEKSGIKMDVITNQPAIVVFTPKKFPNLSFKNQAKYSDFPSICFETQNFPDAPNHSNFPNSLLDPDQTYINESSFKFSIKSL